MALYAWQMHMHGITFTTWKYPVKITMLIFKLLWRPSLFCKITQINSLSGIKVQNVKLIRQAVFNLVRPQAVSSIGYNVNLQTAVAVILVLVECPKLIASEVLRTYQNVKSIWQAVFKIPRTQAIVNWRTGPFHNMSLLSTGVLKLILNIQN